MAEYVFEREFTSPRSSTEVYDEIDDHLIEKLGGKVHYSRARRKYVVQGPSRGIRYGPFMKLKIFFDLRTDNQGEYLLKVSMEKKPSKLLWAIFPIGIILTFSGIPLFWLPLLYLFANPKADIEKVIDSFIWKMNKDVIKISEPRREVYEAIIVEKGEEAGYKNIPEGKIYMASNLKKLMAISLGITFVGGSIAVMGYQFFQKGTSAGLQLIPLGLLFMIIGAIMMIVIMVKMAKTE